MTTAAAVFDESYENKGEIISVINKMHDFCCCNYNLSMYWLRDYIIMIQVVSFIFQIKG